MASNLLNYNVNTMSLARTYWGIPSSSFEMGAIPPSPVGFASGLRGDIAPISQDSDGIGRCVLPRLTALTLLLSKLKPFKPLKKSYFVRF